MPTIAVFTDGNFLSIEIIAYLLTKLFRVVVFCNDPKSFLTKIEFITNKTNLEVLDESEISSYPETLYAIFLYGFMDKDTGYRKFINIYERYNFTRIKSLAIFPYEIFSSIKTPPVNIKANLGIIFVGDLIGPRIDLDSNLILPQMIYSAIDNKEITFGIGQVLRLVNAQNAAKEIVKWIFSFGPYGESVFVFGKEVSSDVFWKALSKKIVNLKIKYDDTYKVVDIPKQLDIRKVPTSLSQFLDGPILWRPNRKNQSIKKNKRKIPLKFKNDYLKYTFWISLIVLVIPFILLTISFVLIFSGAKTYTKGSISTSTALIKSSLPLIAIAREESRFLKHVPLLNLIYRETYFISDVGYQVVDSSKTVVNMVSYSSEFMNNIMGDGLYSPDDYVNKITPLINDFSERFLILKGDIQSQISDGSIIAKYFVKKVDIARYEGIINGVRKVIPLTPELLGANERKDYLVLFQNNMELRPTGGFIGSYGILSFEGGRMVDLSVSDVYSADGQLRGHVEPPTPIRNYLGEGGWYLRDSNWDPDFTVSAKRAEWFLDKEVDKQVDGVLAIDLYPIRELLGYTGSIYLADYGIDISKENLYEKTQEETHQNFFEGSRLKASFLTALSRNLISTIENGGGKVKISLLKVLLNSLESRHVQAYLHDASAQSVVSNLDWDGGVKTLACSGNCLTDFTGLVEANLGVNKANYFIKRDQNLLVSISKNKVERKLTVNFTNLANPSLGDSAKYKNYMRIIIPKESNVESILEINGQSQRVITPDIDEKDKYKEIGFIMEMLPGTSKKIYITWSNEVGLTTGQAKYRLYIRKQAGTPDNEALRVQVNTPGSLTDSPTHLYNTVSAKDFYTQIQWKNTF